MAIESPLSAPRDALGLGAARRLFVLLDRCTSHPCGGARKRFPAIALLRAGVSTSKSLFRPTGCHLAFLCFGGVFPWSVDRTKNAPRKFCFRGSGFREPNQG